MPLDTAHPLGLGGFDLFDDVPAAAIDELLACGGETGLAACGFFQHELLERANVADGIAVFHQRLSLGNDGISGGYGLSGGRVRHRAELPQVDGRVIAPGRSERYRVRPYLEHFGGLTAASKSPG